MDLSNNQSDQNVSNKIGLEYIFLAFVFNFLALIISVVAHRPLFGDAAVNLFNLLTSNTYIDFFYRYSEGLYQVPAMFLRYFEAPIDQIIRAYEIVLTFHPYLSLGACYLLLLRRDRLDLFLFPILSFVFCTQISLAFSISGTLEVISLFWPAWLYFLTLARTPRSVDVAILLAYFSIMVFAHEMAAVTFLLFIFFFLRREKVPPNKRFNLFAVSVFVLGLIWFLLKTKVLIVESADFYNSLWTSRDPFPFLAIGCVLLIGSGILMEKLGFGSSMFSKCIVYSAPFLPLLILVYHGDPHISDARSARGLMVAPTVLLAILSLYDLRNVNIQWIISTAGTFLIMATLRDLHITQNWSELRSEILEIAGKEKGCVVLPRSKDEEKWDDFRPIPLLSLILLRDRETIVFPPGRSASCSLLGKGFIELGKLDVTYIKNEYFKLPEPPTKVD